MRGFAEALEVVPYTLAENAGLDPISIVTQLRNLHAGGGGVTYGINVKKVCTCVGRTGEGQEGGARGVESLAEASCEQGGQQAKGQGCCMRLQAV